MQAHRSNADSGHHDAIDASAGGGLPSPETAGREYIAYMADMIEELCTLANRAGCPTLAGILQLARNEAEREARRR